MKEYSIEWFKWHWVNNSKWLGTQAIKLFAHYIQLEERAQELENLWFEYLAKANLYSDVYGIEIPEELSGRLDIGLPFARKVYKALGGK